MSATLYCGASIVVVGRVALDIGGRIEKLRNYQVVTP